MALSTHPSLKGLKGLVWSWPHSIGKTQTSKLARFHRASTGFGSNFKALPLQECNFSLDLRGIG